MKKVDDLFVCADCYLQHETGENENPDPRWSLGGFEHALRMLTLGEHHVVSGDSDKDHEFSWSRCDLCGSVLGGSRHHLAVLQEEPACISPLQSTAREMGRGESMSNEKSSSADPRLIRGTRRGYRSVAVIVWPDGSITRADVRADLAVRMNKATAAKALGMTTAEFAESTNQEKKS